MLEEVIVGISEVASVVVVGPDVGVDPGAAPTTPVDARTATVYAQSGDVSLTRGS